MAERAAADTGPPLAEPFAEAPLAHRAPLFTADGRAGLAEWPFVPKIILRADPVTTSAAVEAAIGTTLPAASLSSVTVAGTSVLWLGPDEFMVVAPDGEADALAQKLEAGLSDHPRQVVDVSDHYTVVTVSGTASRDLLARLVTIDLHPSAFPAGRVVGTLAGHANVTVWLRDDSPSAGAIFDVIVRASMADYVWCLFAEAGRTFGLPPEAQRAGEAMRA